MNPLPQDCIVEILPLTSPVSMIFKSAADSDDVWNQFLPSDLPDGFVAPDHEKFLVHHDSHLVQIIHIVMMSPPLHTVGMDVDEINATQDWQRRTADYS